MMIYIYILYICANQDPHFDQQIEHLTHKASRTELVGGWSLEGQDAVTPCFHQICTKDKAQ
jgi:hypothetical protein